MAEGDELGSFVFRSTSFNSIRALAARMRHFNAVSRGLLACMPLELKLRSKSTTQSYRSTIYYVDLVVRDGMTLEEAFTQARELDERRKAAGFDLAGLDEVARLSFGNGAFEENLADIPAVTEEFFPDSPDNNADNGSDGGDGADDTPFETVVAPPTSLTDKLGKKMAAQSHEAPTWP